MNTTIKAQRDMAAQQRLVAAAKALAERFEQITPQVQALEEVSAKDPAMRALFEREALAGVLEALVASTEPKAKELKGKKA